MNVKLLRKVKKHILEEPKRLYMSDYIKVESEHHLYGRGYAKCGTAACIAGWTCILSLKETPDAIRRTNDVHATGGELLGLTPGQAYRLFVPSVWPQKFTRGTSDDGSEATAKVAAARIEHFIKTEGRK